jgi:hypothetical protein
MVVITEDNKNNTNNKSPNIKATRAYELYERKQACRSSYPVRSL